MMIVLCYFYFKALLHEGFTLKRYTLSLPESIHEELVNVANENGVSVRDIVLRCIKFGLLGINIDSDPNKELLIKETMDGKVVEETKLLFI